MQDASLSPFSVVEYNKDYVIEFVRYTTRWHDRSEVAKKAQLQYICNYLETDHMACKTIVAESEYIDRHFLEDYAEYYARCFPSHPRKCARLHFFSEKFSEQEFRSALNECNQSFTKKLQDCYLGFAVIRPVPHTVFARVCLIPYKQITENAMNGMITRPTTASLFGVTLTVNALPFIEQDKVVAACATSALWVTLSANSEMALNNTPSPSHITKSATAGGVEANRTFPTNGLFPAQILRALRHFGLEASIAWDYKSSGKSILKSLIYSHLKIKSPVILGGELFRKVNGSVKYIGSHLICAVGYAVGPKKESGDEGPNLWSDRINKLYVHDDRCGPYLRLDFNEIKIEYEGKEALVYEMGVKGHGTWYFEPTLAIIGVYHKIRITHQQIIGICRAFYWCLGVELDRTGELLGEDGENETFKQFDRALSSALSACWEVHLTTGSVLKERTWRSDSFYSYNGFADKSSVLTSSMPKYIWVCRLVNHDATGCQSFAELLFDATEIPQGQVLLGCIAHSEDAHALWALVENSIKSRNWPSYGVDSEEIEDNISSFLRFFSSETNSAYLNSLYGPIGLPRRPLKPGEASAISHVSQRTDLIVIRRGEHARDWSQLDKDVKYIWVINEFGDIVIGEDVNENDEFQGHPTLLDGKPGRIAGEIYMPGGGTNWIINIKSRAYSSHIEMEDGMQYLKNVIENNLSGLPVSIE